MEYVGQVPAPPLDRFIDDTGRPPDAARGCRGEKRPLRHLAASVGVLSEPD